jgi:hypothetical protein
MVVAMPCSYVNFLGSWLLECFVVVLSYCPVNNET